MEEDYRSLIGMFIGGVLIGIYFNASNIMATDYTHVYFSTITLIYSVIFMASNVTILKMMVTYWATGNFDILMFIVFATLSVLTLIALRKQVFVDESQWLKRMITHHSGAITTSKEIVEKTEDPEVKNLAEEMIDTQEEEIHVMEKLLENYA
jgi:Domain of unknown function (DUF305)